MLANVQPCQRRSTYDGPLVDDDLIAKLAQQRVAERIGDVGVGPLDRVDVSRGTVVAADGDPAFGIVHDDPQANQACIFLCAPLFRLLLCGSRAGKHLPL